MRGIVRDASVEPGGAAYSPTYRVVGGVETDQQRGRQTQCPRRPSHDRLEPVAPRWAACPVAFSVSVSGTACVFGLGSRAGSKLSWPPCLSGLSRASCDCAADQLDRGKLRVQCAGSNSPGGYACDLRSIAHWAATSFSAVWGTGEKPDSLC